MTLEEYRETTRRAAKLKTRANGLLADGASEDRANAAVLFHNAARLEREAFGYLDAPSPLDRLLSSVEECACVVAGLDPFLGADLWKQAQLLARDVPPAEAAAILAKTRPSVERLQREFAVAIRGAKTLQRIRGFTATNPADVAAAERELNVLVDRFPGVGELWFGTYRHAFQRGEAKRAWAAIDRAAQLAYSGDSHDVIGAERVFAATSLLPDTEARAIVDELSSAIDEQPGEVRLGLALAHLEFARLGPDRSDRIRRAIVSLPDERASFRELGLAAYARAVRLIALEMRSGREATADVFRRVGLDHIARMMESKGQRDAVRFAAEQASALLDVPLPIAA